ncbi:TRAP transporter small permease subunit [Falsiroseomonas tokyonensis]|uniref:TRAP transporter small permease protein n=1 Tax=Falsiroseomonas tokyonensis TaxID=430521 RepID=A0ABV7BSY0_9PROT|nr:TRAP transporter small permease subunit [Falsiroseomonas tokyonensis]MBU8538286.1 TRAP transporter small permease subunit [Falsiroseomonas tokyonensis]
MQRVLIGIDRLSTVVGQIFAWTVVILTGVIVYDVVARRFFAAPTTWAFDTSYMLYGTLFMMAGAYALSRNGHVRGDFLYRMFNPRLQAKFDLVLYLVFFFPAIFAFMISGWHFAVQSWAQNEQSSISPNGPIIWPFKFLIPIVGLLLLLQGAVEFVRCLQCIRTGAWPQRLSDVEELDQQILAAAEAKGAEALAAEMARGGEAALVRSTNQLAASQDPSPRHPHS